MVLIVLLASPVMAYDPPSQDSSNATDVIIWHGDTSNVTIISNNVSVSGPVTVVVQGAEEAAEKAAIAFAREIGAQLMALFWVILEAVIVFLLAHFAYRYGDRFLFWFAGFAVFFYGVFMFSDIYYLSVLVMAFGLYTLYKAKFDKKSWGKKRDDPHN
jgi:hypothetical protein